MEVSFSSRGATSAGTADNAPEHAALLRRFDAIGSRLTAAERALGIAPQNSSVAGISPAAAPSLARVRSLKALLRECSISTAKERSMHFPRLRAQQP